MKKLLTIFIIMIPVLLAGCASTLDDKTEVPLDSDPRVGEEVSQVCFTRNIDSWQNVDNDRNAVIVEMNNRETYKLKLSGACDPDWATVSIAVITRSGSTCFSRGDSLKTDGDMARGHGSACTISRIYKWNPEAVSQPEK
jgi:hypothetical protein